MPFVLEEAATTVWRGSLNRHSPSALRFFLETDDGWAEIRWRKTPATAADRFEGPQPHACNLRAELSGYRAIRR